MTKLLLPLLICCSLPMQAGIRNLSISSKKTLETPVSCDEEVATINKIRNLQDPVSFHPLEHPDQESVRIKIKKINFKRTQEKKHRMHKKEMSAIYILTLLKGKQL